MGSIGSYHINTYSDTGNTVYDMHIHDAYEFNFIDTDNVNVVYEDRAFFAGRGDVFIFQPFSFHKIVANNMVYTRHVSHFAADPFIDLAPCLSVAFSYITHHKPFFIRLNETQQEQLRNLVGICHRSLVSDAFMYDFINVSAMGNLLNFIITIHQQNNNKNNTINSINHPISQILKYILENYNQDITVEHITEKFNISSTKLYTMFKEYVDMSFKDYLIRLRLSKAMSFLKKGMSVTEVSNMVGFNSYAHFIRTFTQRMGIPPKKYASRIDK